MTQETRRPHLLFIMTDQQFAGAMSCAGNDELATPAIDSLADTGVRFDRAYCAQPLCSPSRASMLTGLWPHQAGVTTNGVRIDELLGSQGLGALLSDAGYECAYGGKWHLPEGNLQPGYGFEPICGFNDHQLADACIEFLQRDHDRPFLLVASFDNPHNICQWARSEKLPWGEIGHTSTPECPSLPANFRAGPYEPEVLRVAQERLPFVHPTSAWDADRWRHYRHAYYRLCEKVDAEIGRILDVLRSTGLDAETLVVFTSDHGDGLGAHQWNQKWTFYEESVRVPLIVSWKGRTLGGAVDTHLVSNGLDLVPTLCDYGQAAPPTALPGHSLRPLLEGRPTSAWRDAVAAETRWNELPGPPVLPRSSGRMLRTERYKYAVYSWGQHREQLFDLDHDPGEMVNLAVQARHESVLQEHRERLARHCSETEDDFRVPI